MVLWRGRLIFRQYIENKWHKYGVKLHELCESTGIILCTFIYSGLSYPDPHDLGQTGAIVMSLLTNFIGKAYTAYVDNYYNTVQLTQQLSSNKTYICGTFLSDRIDNPTEVTKKKLQKGKMIWRAGTVSACEWKDCRVVLTISYTVKFIKSLILYVSTMMTWLESLDLTRCFHITPAFKIQS